MTHAEAILIGLRSALVILCVSGLSAMFFDNQPRVAHERWRRRGWGAFLVSTGLIWSPLALMNLAGSAMLSWYGGSVGMALRLLGSLGYIIAILAVIYSKALADGLSFRRARAAPVPAFLIVVGCVGLSLMVRR